MTQISLYIHFPWCIKKCPYCDFNSHIGFSEELEKKYINALIAELDYSQEILSSRIIDTIFMGGGTPSLFSAKAINRLIEYINQKYNIAKDVEITLEANPGTFEINKFNEYRKCGINRLSIGVQSFDDELLKNIGRVHDGKEAIRAVEVASKIFTNINLDLIYALPGQNLTRAKADVDLACSFAPTHLSLYELTIEANTYFYRHPPQLIDDNEKDKIAEELINHLVDKKYFRYEVSSYANEKQLRCRHNINYWQYGDYLGIGAGAHSKININHKIFRFERIKHPQSYLKNIEDGKIDKNINTNEIIGDERIIEFMMNALRLREGFPLSLFIKRTDLSINVIENKLQQAENWGLLNITKEFIIPTEFGYKNLNRMLEIFID